MIKDALKIKNIFSRRLLAWYRHRQRLLPWRETRDPYRIWISEIMLQQTQVDTVIPYYRRFLTAFPDVFVLADASLQDVLKAWENLGYYSRARHLHAAAGMIVSRFGGRIPDTEGDIKKLPGVGDYSAGAILSIAYEKQVPAVDGNVRRVLSRVLAIRKPMDDARERKKMYQLAAALVPARRPGDFNQAVMDLGATICRAKNPGCTACPVRSLCRALSAGLQECLPLTRKHRAVPHRKAVAGIIRNPAGKILVVQRPEAGLLASLWKFPGGFIEETEDTETGLRRTVKEETGIAIRPERKTVSVDHAYTHFRLTLDAFDCRLGGGRPRTLGCQNWRWATVDDLKKLPMSKIDRMLLKQLNHLQNDKKEIQRS